MKKYTFKLVAILLFLVGVLIPNQAFADTTYRNVPERCYKYFDTFNSLAEASMVTFPVNCTIELGNTDGFLANFLITDSDIVKVSGSAEDGFVMKMKKVGSSGVTLVFSDGSSQPTYINILDIVSNNSIVVNDTIKQYLLDNYSSVTSGKAELICNLEAPFYCRVEIYLTIKDLQEDDLTEDEQNQVSASLGDSNVLSYGDISLETKNKEGDSIEDIDSFGEYTVDVLWGGLDLGKPADGYERNFYVIRLSDGEKIPAEVDGENNLVFPTSKFGAFAVVYEDVRIEDEAKEKAGAPDTGASTETNTTTGLSLVGCLASGIVLAFMMSSKVKKYIKK